MHQRSRARATGLCCALSFLPHTPLSEVQKKGCLVARGAVEWRSLRPRRIPLRKTGALRAAPLPVASCLRMSASCCLLDASAAGVLFHADTEPGAGTRRRHLKEAHPASSKTASLCPCCSSAPRSFSSSELPTLRCCDHQQGGLVGGFFREVFARRVFRRHQLAMGVAKRASARVAPPFQPLPPSVSPTQSRNTGTASVCGVLLRCPVVCTFHQTHDSDTSTQLRLKSICLLWELGCFLIDPKQPDMYTLVFITHPSPYILETWHPRYLDP